MATRISASVSTSAFIGSPSMSDSTTESRRLQTSITVETSSGPCIDVLAPSYAARPSAATNLGRSPDAYLQL